MQRYLSIILLLIPLSSFCSIIKKNETPVVKNGIIDLRNWNFDQNGTVPLSGEYKFIWMQDSLSFIKSNYDDRSWNKINVPGFWNDITGEAFGYGTLRLKVILNRRNDLGISLVGALSAYSIYVDEQPLMKNGKIGHTRETYLPQFLPETEILPPADTLTITWFISNFSDVHGGPYQPIVIGKYRDIQTATWKNIFLDGIIEGVFLIMAMYHLFLWIRRKRDESSLYFALLCLVIFVRMLATHFVIDLFFPTYSMYNGIRKVEYLTITIGWTIFSIFYSKLYPKAFSVKILNIVKLLGITCSLFIIFTECWTFSRLLLVYQIILVAVGFWIIYGVVRSRNEYRSEAFILLPASIIFILLVFNDVLYANQVIHTYILTPYGLLILVFAQSLILSHRFAIAYETSEHLSHNLKLEVEKKTKAILEQKKELEISNGKLKEMDRYKTVFFQNVSHEFRTPLTLILGPIQSMISGKHGNLANGITEKLNTIHKNAQKIYYLINHVLEIAKLDSKKMNLSFKKVDVNKTLALILAHFDNIINEKNITVEYLKNPNELISYIDVVKFERIIFNLLSNAVKFTNNSIVIQVHLKTTKSTGDTMEISIKDNGLGIPEKKLSQIYNRFYQVENSVNAKRNVGSGIGLAIVKDYIELFNGTITTTSTVGSGTEFIILMPVFDSENAVLNSSSESNGLLNIKFEEESTHHDTPSLEFQEVDFLLEEELVAGSESEKHTASNVTKANINEEKVLIVEDNPDMLTYLKDILDNSYSVMEASNGEEGFVKALEFLPDLIISDIMMAGMDGLSLCKKIKIDNRINHIPVILLTARTSIDDKISGIESGADDYITKPFNKALLTVRVKNIIESRKKLRALYMQKFILEPTRITPESNNETFLKKAMEVIEVHMGNDAFDVKQFSEAIGMSHTQLYRKLNNIIGQSPSDFIKAVRLKRAAQLLENCASSDQNISSIAYMVGFTNTSHFAKAFKKHFNETPSEYAKKFSLIQKS